MKKSIKILITLISIILILFSNNVLAISNPSAYDPTPTLEGSESFLEKVGPVLGVIRVAGMLVSVIALAIIGLKYMFSSVEGKAEYKKTMFPYIMGCFMIMGISFLLGIIESLSL